MKNQTANESDHSSTALLEIRPGKPFPLVGVVDDDDSIRETISGILKSADYRTVVFESADAFLRWDNKHDMGCVVLDIPMSGLSSQGLQRRLAEINFSIPVIFLTGRHDEGSRVRALHQGAAAVLPKPFSRDSLLATIQSVLTPITCKERNALLESYNAANLLYNHCISELHQRRGTCTKAVYDNLDREAEDLRNGVYRAFADLERHLAEHRCESITLHHAAGR